MSSPKSGNGKPSSMRMPTDIVIKAVDAMGKSAAFEAIATAAITRLIHPGSSPKKKKQVGLRLTGDQIARVRKGHDQRSQSDPDITLNAFLTELIDLGLDQIDPRTGKRWPAPTVIRVTQVLDINQFYDDDELCRAMDECQLMLWASNSNGEHLYANRLLQKFMGLTAAKFRRGHWLDYIFSRDMKATQTICTEGFQSRRRFDFVYRLRRADKTYAWIHDYAEPRYCPDGRFAGHIGTLNLTNGPDRLGDTVLR